DNSGVPGSVLATTTVSGTANETSLGNDNVGDPLFSYSANLSTAFNAAAGTQYWLSIVPDVGFPPQWGWETGPGGDAQAYQAFFGTGGSILSDVAFTLNGTNAVPEPSTLVLSSLGGVGFLVYGWRRRQALV